MEPALTAEELARRYPHLTPEQRREQEQWHRGRIHNRMVGLPVDENEQPPYPAFPPGSHKDQGFQLARTHHIDPYLVIGLRPLNDQAKDIREIPGHFAKLSVQSQTER